MGLRESIEAVLSVAAAADTGAAGRPTGMAASVVGREAESVRATSSGSAARAGLARTMEKATDRAPALTIFAIF